jgi:hypothetical protein
MGIGASGRETRGPEATSQVAQMLSPYGSYNSSFSDLYTMSMSMPQYVRPESPCHPGAHPFAPTFCPYLQQDLPGTPPVHPPGTPPGTPPPTHQHQQQTPQATAMWGRTPNSNSNSNSTPLPLTPVQQVQVQYVQQDGHVRAIPSQEVAHHQR